MNTSLPGSQEQPRRGAEAQEKRMVAGYLLMVLAGKILGKVAADVCPRRPGSQLQTGRRLAAMAQQDDQASGSKIEAGLCLFGVGQMCLCSGCHALATALEG